MAIFPPFLPLSLLFFINCVLFYDYSGLVILTKESDLIHSLKKLELVLIIFRNYCNVTLITLNIIFHIIMEINHFFSTSLI